MEKFAKRFWAKVEVRGIDDCWLWQASHERYGFFNFRKTVLAHRFAYEQKHGEGSAKGYTIRHTCDTPLCCNPKHLIRGTDQDNMNDKIARGRARNLKGNECSWSKLTEDDVRVIKKLLKKKIYHKEIAKKFNVHCVTITDINIGRSWRHV